VQASVAQRAANLIGGTWKIETGAGAADLLINRELSPGHLAAGLHPVQAIRRLGSVQDWRVTTRTLRY
jgi:hypothetical protein